MNITQFKQALARFAFPPWLILASTLLLSAIIVTVSLRDRNHETALVTRVLFEKGTSLTHALEGALRTGMGFHWTDEELQDILEKMGTQSDIRYMAITNDRGFVLAANLAELADTTLLPADALQKLHPTPTPQWIQDTNAFLVYSTLTVPKFNERMNMYGHMRRRGMMSHGHRGMMPPPTVTPEQNLTLFVGYDLAPLDEAAQTDSNHFYSMTGLLLVLNLAGLGGFGIVRALRRAQHRAQDEIERLHKALRQRERLAALGNMAAGIAHEIRNPLGAIKGLARFFQEVSPPESEESRVAAIMTREVLRLDDVVGDLLDFARPDTLRRGPMDLNELIERTQRLIQTDLDQQHIVFTAIVPPAMPTLHMDSDRLTQALLNLLLNSVQAMPEHGSLSVQVNIAHGELVIRITDTGCGMDETTISRLFTPYFTTKAKGTGLGLPIVHKIIAAHEGNLDVQSVPGKGTVVSLHFPLAVVTKEMP